MHTLVGREIPFVRGAYSSFQPGQLTQYGAYLWVELDVRAEQQEMYVSRLVFASKHLSDEHSRFHERRGPGRTAGGVGGGEKIVAQGGIDPVPGPGRYRYLIGMFDQCIVLHMKHGSTISGSSSGWPARIQSL